MRKRDRRAWLALVMVAAAIIALCGPTGAEQGSDDKSFEKTLDVALRDVINHGASLFNDQGDYAGCYRIFEGSLKAVKPLLGKYPDLQKKIDAGLADANSQPSMHDRAHSLRKILDEVRTTINPSLRVDVASKLPPPVKKESQAKKEIPPDPNMARPKGTVSIAGKKLTHGFVTFVGPVGKRFSANVQKDGAYLFKKGFPPGEYLVMLEDATTPAAAGEMRLEIPALYKSDTTSPLRFKAAKGEVIFHIEIDGK